MAAGGRSGARGPSRNGVPTRKESLSSIAAPPNPEARTSRAELEGMIAAQLLAAHYATMECYRRAMLLEQTFEGRSEKLNQANKLSRTYAVLLDALNRHRGKGQQKVTVEHVHVHSGGQAVVGMVAARGSPKLEDQSHAKQIAYAPQPAMRSADKEREPVPVARDAERPVPTARRNYMLLARNADVSQRAASVRDALEQIAAKREAEGKKRAAPPAKSTKSAAASPDLTELLRNVGPDEVRDALHPFTAR
jgi:hypothetical protein